jgi:hypothetical protein
MRNRKSPNKLSSVCMTEDEAVRKMGFRWREVYEYEKGRETELDYCTMSEVYGTTVRDVFYSNGDKLGCGVRQCGHIR